MLNNTPTILVQLSIFVATLASSPILSFSSPIKETEFYKLSAIIKPQASEEKWIQIPWQADLWKARQQAAVEHKPILLWEMDGHPLGCT